MLSSTRAGPRALQRPGLAGRWRRPGRRSFQRPLCAACHRRVPGLALFSRAAGFPFAPPNPQVGRSDFQKPGFQQRPPRQ